MSKNTEREIFYQKVNTTKNALIREWNVEGCFKDKNNFRRGGLIPEGIGLTSILLMLIAFREDEKVFPTNIEENDADTSDFERLINSSFKKIFEWTEGGFGAAPLLNKKNSALFDENRGYTETVTWCLSSSILALYAENKLGLSIEKEVRDGILNLLGKSFKAFLSAQRPDGTWGFTTDGKGCRSLYFTYIANATLSDFFDYVMDEISIVETANSEKTTATPMKEIISFLDGSLGIDSVDAAKKARERLDKFLIETCLPVLPKLARCESLSEDELNALGAWSTSAYPDEKAENKKYFHNLYYTYYILDMLITANADVYFNNLVKDEQRCSELLKIYSASLEDYEVEYYSDAANFAELFTNFYEQALHSSRMNYMKASRTGANFWDMTASELPIKWEHEDADIQKLAKTALDQSQATLTDPTILPMALRANTVYSYYVTEKPEITIERLFDDVCNNVYTDEIEEDDDEHALNLWDTVYYNLMITERSIESIVDFYDYLNKFNSVESAAEPKAVAAPVIEKQSVATPAPAITSVDAAIEAKIEEYFCSDKVKAAIDAMVAKRLSEVVVAPTTDKTSTMDVQALIAQIESLVSEIKIQKKIEPKGVEYEQLAAALVDLNKELRMLELRTAICSMSSTKNETDAKSKAKNYKKREDELLEAIIPDLNDPDNTLAKLYEKLKLLKGMGED